MKKILTLVSIALLFSVTMAQTVTLTFTGRDVNNQNVPLNRVVINNITKGWQETLTWPDDTAFVVTATGIVDHFQRGNVILYPNSPNPFDGVTSVKLQISEPGDVMVEISDVTGRVVKMFPGKALQAGVYDMRVTVAAAGVYFLKVRQNNGTASVKMINRGNGGENSVTFSNLALTNQSLSSQKPSHASKGGSDNPFTPGDQMEYVGYATINGSETESEHVVKQQYASETIVLTFGSSPSGLDGQPCPGDTTIIDVDSNVYHTVMIGTQCWMKENLRTTRYANGVSIPEATATSTTSPFRCAPNRNAQNVPTYGYLYNWAAVMHGASSSNNNPSGVQGICPTGWHVPSAAEWTQLTDYVKSQSQYLCGTYGSYIAKALASTTGWNNCSTACTVGNSPSTNNATGFSARPAGYYRFSNYDYFGSHAHIWSSTQGSSASYARILEIGNDYTDAYSMSFETLCGISVRCLRD